MMARKIIRSLALVASAVTVMSLSGYSPATASSIDVKTSNASIRSAAPAGEDDPTLCSSQEFRQLVANHKATETTRSLGPKKSFICKRKPATLANSPRRVDLLADDSSFSFPLSNCPVNYTVYVSKEIACGSQLDPYVVVDEQLKPVGTVTISSLFWIKTDPNSLRISWAWQIYSVERTGLGATIATVYPDPDYGVPGAFSCHVTDSATEAVSDLCANPGALSKGRIDLTVLDPVVASGSVGASSSGLPRGDRDMLDIDTQVSLKSPEWFNSARVSPGIDQFQRSIRCDNDLTDDAYPEELPVGASDTEVAAPPGCVFKSDVGFYNTYPVFTVDDSMNTPTIAYNMSNPQSSACSAVSGPKSCAFTRASMAEKRLNRSAACPSTFVSEPSYSCDEFPFASSKQGAATAADKVAGFRRVQTARPDCGYNSPAFPEEVGSPSLLVKAQSLVNVCSVPLVENNRQGGYLSAFYRKNRIVEGDPYRVVLAAQTYILSSVNTSTPAQTIGRGQYGGSVYKHIVRVQQRIVNGKVTAIRAFSELVRDQSTYEIGYKDVKVTSVRLTNTSGVVSNNTAVRSFGTSMLLLVTTTPWIPVTTTGTNCMTWRAAMDTESVKTDGSLIKNAVVNTSSTSAKFCRT